jgi:hypothetical protein
MTSRTIRDVEVRLSAPLSSLRSDGRVGQVLTQFFLTFDDGTQSRVVNHPGKSPVFNTREVNLASFGMLSEFARLVSDGAWTPKLATD